MKIYKKNKRYRFKEDRLELFSFVNVKITHTVEDMSVIIADYNIGSPNRYFSRHL